jgi:hypothetical protein
MAFLRTILNFVVAGALLGLLAATLAFPRFSVWYNTPATKALCDCAETTRQTAEALINAQLTSCAVGAGLGLVGGGVFVSMRRKKAKAKEKVPSAPAPSAK